MSATNNVVRIGMWSGPRNLSTAMMRSWENRADTVVLDEPLYGAYLAATGSDHPMKADIIAAGPADFDSAIASCLAPLPNGQTVSYQKQMAHHLLPHVDRSWTAELVNVFLLRDPRRVIASYLKKRESATILDIGLPQQQELFERFGGGLVIDSADFLTKPERYSRAVCEAAGVTFDEAMLTWPIGPRDSDGVWAPAWYDAVWGSTGFAPPDNEPVPAIDPLFADLVDEAMSVYETLAQHRLIL